MVKGRLICILYMEDDPGEARLLQKKLERLGHSVEIAPDGQQGLVMCQTNRYDLLLVDQKMPVYNGLEVIRILASEDALPSTIMLTGAGDEQIAVEAMKLGVSDYIVKDIEGRYLNLLPAVIEQVLNQQTLLKQKQEAEVALRQYAKELKARNEELDAFAHTVAHDLRGPLTQLIGRSEVLSLSFDSLTEEEVQKQLQAINYNGHKMNNIIDELLLLTGVRKQTVTPTPLDMGAIVAEALQHLTHLIKENKAQITTANTWPTALGHAHWIEEVWVNYISNAIKYGGNPPRIELGATAQADDKVRFWVRDNGAGVAPEEKARLFTPFTRLNQVRIEGYGLGLSIVQRIIDKLGGEVGVESELGQGSTFFFVLPAQQVAKSD